MIVSLCSQQLFSHSIIEIENALKG